jgi:hypothetical protein
MQSPILSDYLGEIARIRAGTTEPLDQGKRR